MAINEEIARLTGTLVWKVDNRPLLAFQNRLAKVTTMLNEFSAVANKKFGIKVALDSKTLRAQLDKAANAKIVFKNFHIDAIALDLIQVRLKDKLDNTRINLKNIKINVSEVIAQRAALRSQLEKSIVGISVHMRFQEANTQLREWKKVTESKFKLYINADISQAKFYRNAAHTLKVVGARLGTINIKSPKVKLSVDRVHLRAEIASVLEQIKREVRIKIDLNSMVSGRGGSGSNMANQRRAAAHGGFAGGMLGEGMGLARGFIPGLGAAMAIGQLNKINQQMQAQQLAMTAVMGSESAGQKQSAWVKNLSNNIGMDYRQVAPSYNKMLASGQTSGMSTKSVQNIFQGVSEYGRVMGLDSEAMKGSMRAIEQMMNKGQVMSEELKGQLAERMPGAMSAMAEAAGFGSDEKGVGKLMDAMKNGTVKSTAVLEKFAQILAQRARQGGALEKAMQSTAAQQARMNNAFTDSVMNFAGAGFDSAMGKFFKTLADGMERAQPLIKALGGAFQIIIEPVNALIRIVSRLGENFKDAATGFGMTGKQLALLPLLLFPVITTLGLLLLAIDDIMTFNRGGTSLFGNWLKDNDKASQAFDDMKNSLSELKKTWKELTGSEGNDSFKSTVEWFTKAIGTMNFNDMFISTMHELARLMDTITATINRFTGANDYSRRRSSPDAPEGGMEQGMNFIKGLTMSEAERKADIQGDINRGNLTPITPDELQAKNDYKARGRTTLPGINTPLETELNFGGIPQSQAPLGVLTGAKADAPVNVGGVNIYIQGGQDSNELATKVRDVLQKTFQEYTPKEVK